MCCFKALKHNVVNKDAAVGITANNSVEKGVAIVC